MKKFLFYATLAAGLFLLTTCKPQQRLQRLIKKHPQLTAIDTIHIRHTTILPEIRYREKYTTRPNDTIIIERERLKVEIIRNLDTLYIDVHQPADTIREMIKVPVETIRYEKPSSWHMFWKRLPWILITGLIIFAWLSDKKRKILP
jgi:hypothetical protein